MEVASEIRHLLLDVLPRYYELGDAPRVTIVEGSDRILNGWDEELASAGLEELRRRGIQVRLQSRVEGFDGRTVRIRGRPGIEELEASALIWTAGPRRRRDYPPSAGGGQRVRGR